MTWKVKIKKLSKIKTYTWKVKIKELPKKKKSCFSSNRLQEKEIILFFNAPREHVAPPLFVIWFWIIQTPILISDITLENKKKS